MCKQVAILTSKILLSNYSVELERVRLLENGDSRDTEKLSMLRAELLRRLEKQERRKTPRYKCHKDIYALKLKAVYYKHGEWWVSVADDGYVEMGVTEEWATKQFNKDLGDPGYIVYYEDDYVSWLPTKVFEDGHTRIPREGE